MNDDEVNSMIDRANALYELGKLEEALEMYDKALSQAPNLAWAYSRVGAILAQMEDQQGAEEALKKALELEPTLPQAHSNLGNIYYNRGDYQAALEKYKEAVALSPNNPLFHENLHAAYKKLGRLSEAVSALKQAHRLEREGSRTEIKEKVRGLTKHARGRLGCLGTVLLVLLLGAGVWLL